MKANLAGVGDAPPIGRRAFLWTAIVAALSACVGEWWARDRNPGAAARTHVVVPGAADLAPGTFVTGTASFEDQGRSRVMLRNKGLLHVYADIATQKLVGAEMIGPDAEHIGHLLAWAIQAKLAVADTLAMPFYHPVVEEGLRTALRDAHVKLVCRPADS